MIVEETFEFECEECEDDGLLRVSKIEEFIKSKGISPVRFSLISKEKNRIKLGVSGIKK
ncbi:MAG: hypothetical protein Q4F80_07995 [bacterium]|nr:hypothetical protein [bacterium]